MIENVGRVARMNAFAVVYLWWDAELLVSGAQKLLRIF